MSRPQQILMALSLIIVVLWGAAWLPSEHLSSPLRWFFYWFGGVLTVLLAPALFGIGYLAHKLYIARKLDTHRRARSFKA